MRINIKVHAFFLVTLLAVLAISIFFCVEKVGYFVDEIYSFGLSNSYFAPFIRDVFGGDVTGRVLTNADILDYLATSEADRFAFDSVYLNQAMDVHPPLFYALVHLVSSFFPGVFSKWIGLSINLVIWTCTLILLYRIGLALLDNPVIAACVMGLYGLSGLGLSCMLMVRMYMFLTFWTVLFAFVLVKLYRSPRPYLYVCLFLITFCGLLTQYFFVFYAFFASAAFVITLIVKKRGIKPIVAYCASVICGGLCMLAFFPSCISHMTSGFSGYGSVGEHASDFSAYALTFVTMLKRVSGSGFALIAVVLLLVVLLVFLAARRKLASGGRLGFVPEGIFIVVMAFVAYFVVLFVSPFDTDRYQYNEIPLMALAVGYLLRWVQLSLSRERAKGIIVGLCSVALVFSAIVVIFAKEPSYLYKEDAEKIAFAQEHANDPCVYITSNMNPPISSDMHILMEYDGVLIVSDPSDTALIEDYLKSYEDADSCVVYLGLYNNPIDKDSALQTFQDLYGYSSREPLWKTLLSKTYLFER